MIAAIAAVGLFVSFFTIYSATASEQAAPATQMVLGRVETCTLNTSSACRIPYNLGGAKPTAIVVTPSGPGQNLTIDVTKMGDTDYVVKALWHDGTAFKNSPTIKFNAIYTYVGDVVTPSPSPTDSPSVSPSVTPTQSPSQTPTSPTVTPAGYDCVPSGAVQHFYPKNGGTGNGSGPISGVYDVSAEQWAIESGYLSNLCAYSNNNWYVDIKAIDHGDHAVQAYPSMRKIYHDWGGPEDYTLDPKLSSFSQLKVEVAHTSPTDCAGCIYEEAFDIWLNGIGDGPAQTELMIWTHNQDQDPYGTLKASNVTVDGRQWDVYYGSPDYVAYVPANGASITSGTFDVKAFATDMKNRGILRTAASDPHVGQISYGVEPVDTNGVFKRWTFSKFNVLDS